MASWELITQVWLRAMLTKNLQKSRALALTRQCYWAWPVAVAVFDTDAVVVRYSTIAQSPLSLLHSSINMRLSLVSRALGCAFLAFCLPDEQNIILGLIGQSSDAEDQAAGDLPTIMATLDEVRARGYALRNPSIRPISNTIALPIYEGQRVVASFGLTWFSSALSLQDVRLTLYPAMKIATDEISARLIALNKKRQ